MSDNKFTGEHLLTHVEKSPKAVALHDKPAWLAIFKSNYCVEDPVGSSPHLGADDKSNDKEALARFYDTFIAPNHINFEVAHDIVNGMHVVRDLTVRTQMSDKLTIGVPMHLLYELEEEDGALKIKRLAAHWELLPMIGQVLSSGFACLPVLFALSARMFRFQGLSGVLGFSKAVFSVGDKGKNLVEDFFADLNQKHTERLLEYLEDVEGIEFGESFMKKDALEHWNFDHFEIGKMIAAGNIISVSFIVRVENETDSGVAFFEFNHDHDKFLHVHFYY